MRVSVWHRDLSDSYLRHVSQLGADGIDFGSGDAFPGVKEQGYPDLDGVLEVKRKLRSWGLEINRVTLPDITEDYMQRTEEAEEEFAEDLENSAKAVRVFGEAGIHIARQRFGGEPMPGHTHVYEALHRGGYAGRGEYRHLGRPKGPSEEEIARWWKRFSRVYDCLVPVAEACEVKLALHPSDTPYAGTPFDSLGFHRVIDAFPSSVVGYLYCIGTRAEAGGSALVTDEINNYGRKGRIFAVHFRNVRGSLATAGGFEEVLLDDGDMNMFKILLELQRIGYDGYLNPDHIPALEGDRGFITVGLGYSVGYIKALLAALAALPSR